jgi:CBS domain-containing protein
MVMSLPKVSRTGAIAYDFLVPCELAADASGGLVINTRQVARGSRRKHMTTVRQLLHQKGRNVWSIRPDATVFDAVRKMAENDIGSLVVVKGENVVGIITERHYARNVVLKGKTSPGTAVRDIMETRVVMTRLNDTVERCMALMSDKRVRHLPVLDRGKLVGIVSIGDLVKSKIGDQEFMIDQLEHYIHG